jgi:hypothetical protein
MAFRRHRPYVFQAPGKGRDHTVDSPTGFSRRTYKQPPSAKQKAESTARDERREFTLRAMPLSDSESASYWV